MLKDWQWFHWPPLSYLHFDRFEAHFPPSVFAAESGDRDHLMLTVCLKNLYPCSHLSCLHFEAHFPLAVVVYVEFFFWVAAESLLPKGLPTDAGQS